MKNNQSDTKIIATETDAESVARQLDQLSETDQSQALKLIITSHKDQVCSLLDSVPQESPKKELPSLHIKDDIMNDEVASMIEECFKKVGGEVTNLGLDQYNNPFIEGENLWVPQITQGSISKITFVEGLLRIEGEGLQLASHYKDLVAGGDIKSVMFAYNRDTLFEVSGTELVLGSKFDKAVKNGKVTRLENSSKEYEITGDNIELDERYKTFVRKGNLKSVRFNKSDGLDLSSIESMEDDHIQLGDMYKEQVKGDIHYVGFHEKKHVISMSINDESPTRHSSYQALHHVSGSHLLLGNAYQNCTANIPTRGNITTLFFDDDLSQNLTTVFMKNWQKEDFSDYVVPEDVDSNNSVLIRFDDDGEVNTVEAHMLSDNLNPKKLEPKKPSKISRLLSAFSRS